MAITVLPFPDLPFADFELHPVSMQEVSPMEGRATETADFGTPYWSLTSARTGWLTDAELDIAEAFLQEASAGMTLFECPDVSRLRPSAYGAAPLSGIRAAGGAFDGVATLSSVSPDGRTIVVIGLPAGFAVNRGALVEIRKTSTQRSLHRVNAAAAANVSGVITLQIRFALDLGVFTSGSPTAVFERPSCLMKLLPGWSVSKGRSTRQARFTAKEVFPYG